MFNRKQKRRYMVFYSRIFDAASGRVLGYLHDLTTTGALVISDTPLDPGKVFRLRMDVPPEVADVGTLDFDAEIAWCRPDNDPKYWTIGMRLTGLDEESQETVNAMLESYGLE